MNKGFLTLLSLLILVHDGMGQAMFSSSPAKFRPTLTPNLTLCCSLDYPHVRAIIAIEISKNGTSDARMSSFSSEPKTSGIFNGAVITGHLGGSSGFLQVVFPYPTEDKAGNYECKISGVNKYGQSLVYMNNTSVYDTVIRSEDLIEEVHELKKERDRLSSLVDRLIIDFNSTDQNNGINETSLNEQMNSIETLVQKLNVTTNTKIETIQDQIDAIVFTANRSISTITRDMTGLREDLTSLQTRVYFSAGLTQDMSLNQDETVIYDKVFANLGNGYNQTSGEFVCLKPGYYHFLVYVVSRMNTSADFYLYKNDNMAVRIYADDSRPTCTGTMCADDDHDLQTAANSVVLHLYKHDVVRVVSAADGTGVSGWKHPYMTFTGILLSLD